MNIVKKNLHGLSVGQKRVLEHEFEFLVGHQLGTKQKHSWNDIVERMAYGKKSCLQQIPMRLSKGEPVWGEILVWVKLLKIGIFLENVWKSSSIRSQKK